MSGMVPERRAGALHLAGFITLVCRTQRRGDSDDPWRECFLRGEQSDGWDGTTDLLAPPPAAAPGSTRNVDVVTPAGLAG